MTCVYIKIFEIVAKFGIEEILVIIGSLPDQPGYLLAEYLEQVEVLYPNVLINFVSFDCAQMKVLETLEKLTEVNRKSYNLHVYSSLKESSIMTGDDMLALEQELLKAKVIKN